MQIPQVVILECQRRVYGMMEETGQAKRRSDKAKKTAEARHADYYSRLSDTQDMMQFLVDNSNDPELKDELVCALTKELERPEVNDDEEIFSTRPVKARSDAE